MSQNKYKIKFEEFKAFVIKSIKDPFLLTSEEWAQERDWLVSSYLSEERNYSKQTIKNGEELGIIIFKQKHNEKENVFVFNQTDNFKKAIELLKKRVANYADASLDEIFDQVKSLEAKPCDE